MDTEEIQETQEIQVHEGKRPETTEIDVDNLPQVPPPKRVLTDAQKQAARERVLKAAERKAHYRKIRQELGIGARDPIPEKYKLPTKVREKVVFAEAETKEIVQGDIQELREESMATKVRQEHERALGISAKASTKSQREKALSREAKELRISQVVRQAVDEALLHRSAIKSHLKSQYIDKPQDTPRNNPRDNHRDKHAEQRGSIRMRLPDGRVLQL